MSKKKRKLMRSKKDRQMDLEEVKEVIRNSSQETAIFVGCDSQRYKDIVGWKAVYVTVVVIHHDSSHGAKIFWDCSTEHDYGHRRLRLMNEVYKSVAVAQEILDDVGTRPFQIHLDINRDPNAKSNEVMAEAIGYVKGVLGLDPILKPKDDEVLSKDYPIAASAAADRLATSKAFWN